MKRKKITRATLSELAQTKEIISYNLLKTYVGGGNGSFGSPYTYDEYLQYGGGSSVYFYNGDHELCYCLPEVIVMGGSNAFYNGGTSSGGYAAGYQGGSYYDGGTDTIRYSTLTPDQFKPFRYDDRAGCLRRCDEMLREAGVRRSGEQILMTNRRGNGRTGAPSNHAQKGIDAINSSLAAGNPIVVCVDYMDGTRSGDKQGDHFIVITGSTTVTKPDGNSVTTYNFYDPATIDPDYGASSDNTLMLNKGKLTGSFKKKSGGINKYVVTSVRPNK